MSASANTYNIETVIEHTLTFKVNGSNIDVNQDIQKIIVRDIIIKPSIKLLTFKGISSYKNGIEAAITEAIKYIPNIKIPNTNNRTNNNNNNTNSNEPNNTNNEPNDTNKSDSNTESTNNINESSGMLHDLQEMHFMIKTNRVSITKIVTIENKDAAIKYVLLPEDIKDSINYIESRRIKIFINGIEYKAKNFIEFLKKIFPYINIELTL